jgi:hypothetical protein
MHIATASIFEKFPERITIFNHQAHTQFFERRIEGNQRLVVGRTMVKSNITFSEKQFSFIALYLGQHNIIGNLSTDMELHSFELLKQNALSAFSKGNLGDVITLSQTFFGLEKFTIQDLFYDEKRKILNLIAEKSLKEVESSFRDLYNDNYQLMSTILDANLPIPDAFRSAVAYILNRDLEHYFDQEHLSIKELEKLLAELKKWGIKLNHEATFELSASERIYKEVKKLEKMESSLNQLQLVNHVLEILNHYQINVDIWKSQNAFHLILKSYKEGEWLFISPAWQENFNKLADLLKVKA